MSSVEKRHVSHRMGSMLHHRFPNGFTDLFMDETDREVSILTDRAFRSLCVGDDAVYNDEFLYGYSPFSCHKPLVGDPLKKTHHKESKKHGQSKNEKNNSMPWKQQHHTNISNMSSFLKAFSVTEKSCEGLLNKNGDTNGESWDKSALRSIQRELSEFSSDYHANMKDRKYRNHHGHSEGGTTDKTDNGSVLSSGKSTKVKNGKTTVKLKKLNIKNFFLHSEFSPFQSWRDFNHFPFGQEETVPSILPMDTDPKWYDLPFYKKLTDSHRKEMLHTAESESCQKVELPAVEPPPTAPKPIPPPPPPKVLPKPSASPAEKRCSSHAGEGTAAPWRRNRSRATSAVPVNQPGIPSQDRDTCSRTADESFSVVKKEVKSVEVKAIEECSSVASTPFSICQLMTPVIPSRQPTDTSEILSPSVLDIQLRPNSEAKGTPEPTIKRDGYKSLASSILFNLKDNRKRVKSRYSPPKFKTLELPEDNVQSPSISDDGKLTHGNASGLNTPAILKDGQTVCSPILESPSTPTATFSKHTESHLSDDYLLSNLLQSKKEVVGEENLMSPFLQPKKHRSPAAKRQNYPSLHLYRKAPQEDIDTRYLQVPPNGFGPVHSGSDELSPLMLDKEFPPQVSQTDKELSPNIVPVNQDQLLVTSPHVIEKDKLSPNIQVGISCLMEPDKAEDEEFGFQSISRRKESGSQAISTMDVIRAAKEAINATKNKARSAAHVPENNKPFSDVEEMEQRDLEEKDGLLMDRDDKKREKTVPEDIFISKNRSESAKIAPEDKHSFVKQPPPVPRRNFSKSDVELAVDKHLPNVSEKSTDYDSVEEKLDLPQKAYESISEPTKAKHIFSARLNNYIKNQRCAAVDEEEVRNSKRYEENVNMRTERDEKVYVGDSEHICNDLQALKELERARFGDRVLDNAKNKFGLVNIDKEARVKSDLISKELRNIKRGMLSMRGNTSIKRDIFAKKDKDQEKQEDFPVMDNNVIVNKALINENYDKAKMALEEIISEREKRKKKSTEDAIIDEKVSEERFVKRTQQSKHIMKDSKVEGKEKMSSSSMQKETDIRDRLTDLRDHNLVRQILSHAEPRLGESHRLGGRIALPGMDRAEPQLKTQGKLVINKLADNPTNNLEEEDKVFVERRVSEESAESIAQEIRCQPLDTPRVPPRNKRIGGRRHDSISMLDEDSFYKTEMSENCETGMNNISSTHLEKQEVDSNLLLKEAGPVQSPPISGYDMQSRPTLGVTPKFRGDTMEANDLQKNLSPSWDTMFENSNTKPEDAPKSKQMTPLKTDHTLILDHRAGKVFEVDEVSKRSNLTQDIGADTEAVSETPRSIISPTLMVNGVSINQSPPDQSSLSSKSSYFSVDSALQRKEDVESYVYHSLENMIRDLDKEMLCTSPNTKQDSDRTEYYSLSDHESEPELMRSQIASPLKQTQVPHNDNKERTTFTEQSATHEQDDETTMSPTNTLSPTLGIPSLFKVKDNTFNGKTKKTAQTWAPKTTILQSSEEEVPQEKAAPKLSAIITPEEYIEPKQFVINHSPPVLSELSNLQDKNPKKPQLSNFLTVPQEDSGFSGASPLSEEVESLTTSTVDTVEEIKISTSVPVDHEVSKVPSERSGSTCSGNDSQTGLPKPPAVLPKSEKAVLKAIKLTNRRIKKEEAQKTPHKSSHNSSSKHRSERHKSDKSEQKPSTSRSGSKGSEKKHREKREDDQHHHHHHHSTTGNDTGEQISHEKRGHSIDHTLKDKAQVNSISHRQNLDFLDSNKISKEDLSSVDNERQGRSSNRNFRDKSRRYSVDRVFSNVPVYKAHVGEKSVADRPSNRSQSFDRQVGDKAQRRFSADMSINEKLNTRSQHIEKSIMDGLQQRGRVRDKAPRENTIRRSHSIDAYSTEAPQPPTFSRQSSHNSQLSRQSSYEHAIVTQSFPVTQRKLLQDPDSGQYFVVDMPVQIKTKTFFDPETGSYVQLPVQPQDGTIPQPSPMEVLRSPPLVVYHGFVPVPLSPMAQKTTIQTVSVDPEEFEQRHLERSRQKHCREGQPYLEPVFGQHDHFLGEFMSTEELDCPS